MSIEEQSISCDVAPAGEGDGTNPGTFGHGDGDGNPSGIGEGAGATGGASHSRVVLMPIGRSQLMDASGSTDPCT